MQARPVVIPDAEQKAMQEKLAQQAKMRGGVNWFFWIGGLSIINTILFFTGSTITFLIGLGATQFVDGFASALASELTAKGSTIIYLIGLGLDIGIAGIFITAGLLGRKRYRWAVITGMVLYALDGLIFLLVSGWLEIFFHLFGLWILWTGLRAMNKLKVLESSTPASIPVTTETQLFPWFKSDAVRILARMFGIFIGIDIILAIIGFVLTR